MTIDPQRDLQPILVGETVIIRPIQPEDWHAMYAAASDPLIWELHPVSNRHQEPVFRAFFDGAIAAGSAFSIIDKATGTIIGSTRYYDYDPEARAISIGYSFLIRKHWGGSTNAEVKRLMLHHAFELANVVSFEVGDTNWRSRRAMEKVGGVLTDRTTEIEVNGVTYRHVVFEIRKPGV